MSHRREGKRYREFEDLKYHYYRELRDRRVKVKFSGKLLCCPYCYDDHKKEYDYDDLLRHASRIGNNSENASTRDTARHLGLVEYLERHVDAKYRSSNIDKGKSKVQSKEEIVLPVKHKGDEEPYKAENLGLVKDLERPVDANDQSSDIDKSKPLVQSKGEIALPLKRKGAEESYVWPWMAIVANIPVELKDGRFVGEGGKKMKEDWARQGYNPLKVHTLWTYRGHSGYAIVEFARDWTGFKNLITFEKAFQMINHGKTDWYTARHKGNDLYAWSAQVEEYNANGHIGEYLRKNGDLKTVSDIEMEDRRKDKTLVSKLANALVIKSKTCEDIECKIRRTETFIKTVMKQKEDMIQKYNDEMRMIQQESHDQLERIFKDREQRKLKLEAEREELKLREKELIEREALNESEKMKLDHAKQLNEREIMERKKADEKLLRLAEEQKRKKEKLHKRIIELEKKLDDKQKLELQIQQMRGAIGVMKHMSQDDVELKKKILSIEEDLKQKEEDLDGMEALNQALIVKERKSNDELQDARKELITGLKDSRAFICVKKMGEIDEKPFHAAVKTRFTAEEADEKAVELCSLWEAYLTDPSWHPFKVIVSDENAKEFIDEEDERLKSLRNEYGEEVFMSVITALGEMNKYNPSGRYPVPELWNSKENRKATLSEGVNLLLKQWRQYKRKK